MEKRIANYVYQQKDFLGKGSYSTVYKCIDDQTQEIHAIKIIEKRLMQSQMNAELILGEIEVMKHFNHPNLVQMIDVYQTNNNFYLILEYCPQGDLEQLLKRGPVDENSAISMFLQILQGYEYLYEQNFMHRDLKPANIFFSNNVAKIADFGFAKKYETNTPIKTKQAGSPIYTAPQILLGQYYTYKCDMFSLGIMLYEMLHGTNPFISAMTKDQVIGQMRSKQLRFKTGLSNDITDLILKMTTFEETERIKFEDVKAHPLIQKQNQHFSKNQTPYKQVNNSSFSRQSSFQTTEQVSQQPITRTNTYQSPQPINQQPIQNKSQNQTIEQNQNQHQDQELSFQSTLPEFLNIIIELKEGIKNLDNNVSFEILNYVFNKLIIYASKNSNDNQISTLIYNVNQQLSSFTQNLENNQNLTNILTACNEKVADYGLNFVGFAINQIQQSIRRINHEISIRANKDKNFLLKVEIIQNLLNLKQHLSQNTILKNNTPTMDKYNFNDYKQMRQIVYKEYQ